MDPLPYLSSLLSRQQDSDGWQPTPCVEMDRTLQRLEQAAKATGTQAAPTDIQQRAVDDFWRTQSLDSLKSARLVSFGLCLPHKNGKRCILEDDRRFGTLLDLVDKWRPEPRWFRRCYQGLVTNYFYYDGPGRLNDDPGRGNWIKLRDYLGERRTDIVGPGVNPDWVETVVQNDELFGDAPCRPYAAEVLHGDSARVDRLRGALQISAASWFERELLLAQVREATMAADSEFRRLLPALITILTPNQVLRDSGLVMLLNRYEQSSGATKHQELCDRAVAWWGNPWLSTNSMRWGAVTPAARAMVADWLKLECIEAFFTLLVEEGIGDRRRLEFWKRYVKVIDDIHFALGSDAMYSARRDFVTLRAKMHGRTVELKDAAWANNAFVMTIGDAVLVEFSGRANALYVYRREDLPFKLTKPVVSGKDASNSLKSSRRHLWMKHQDGIHGWSRWEDMFEATLIQNYKIHPSTAAPPEVQSNVVVQFSRDALEALVQTRGLDIDDRTSRGGSLWVLADQSDSAVTTTLTSWGFQFKAGKGWWK